MQYHLTRLEEWAGRNVDLSDVGVWLDLLDDFGFSLFRFLIDETFASQIPVSDNVLREFRKSIEKTPLSTLKPLRGAAWILFAYKGKFTKLPPPFRRDGVMLPFKWTKGPEDCGQGSFLPSGLLHLANRVKTQFGEEAQDWHLALPDYFKGEVDLRFEDATYESAWGALAVGLYLALRPKTGLVAWPFSSIAFDFDRNEPQAVGELKAKINVAASMFAEELAVAPPQVVEAKRMLRELRKAEPNVRGLRYLRIYDWKWTGDLMRSMRQLARCNQHNRLRQWIVGILVNLLVLVLSLGLGIWYWNDCTMEKTSYFADYVTQKGLAIGIFPVNKNHLPNSAYKFVFQGYDSRNPFKRKPILRELWCIDAKGKPQLDITDRPEHPYAAGRKYSYADHRLASVHYLNTNGQKVACSIHSGRNLEVADYDQIDKDDINRDGLLTFGNGFVSPNRDRIRLQELLQGKEINIKDGETVFNRIISKWDENGFLRSRRAQKGKGNERRKLGQDEMVRIDYAHDEHGRIIEIRYMAGNEVKAKDKYGVHLKKFHYSGMNLERYERYSLDGRLMDYMEYTEDIRRNYYKFHPSGSYDKTMFDRLGRCEWIEYRSATGELEPDGQGVAIVQYSYNEKGEKKETFFDKNKKQIPMELKQ